MNRLKIIGLAPLVSLFLATPSLCADDGTSPAMQVIMQLQADRTLERSQRIESLKRTYLMATSQRERLLAALSLGVHALDSSPSLAYQYLISADTLSDPGSALKMIAAAHRAKAALALNAYEEVLTVTQTMLTQSQAPGWEETAWNLRLMAYSRMGAYQESVAALAHLRKKFGLHALLEEAAEDIVLALDRIGDIQQMHEVLESRAAHYPLSPSSRFAFRRLFEQSCLPATDSRHYVYSQSLLTKMSGQLHIDAGLREFLVAAIRHPLRDRDDKIGVLSPTERMEYLRRIRAFDEALSVAEEIAKTFPTVASTDDFIIELAEIYVGKNDPQSALRVLTQGALPTIQGKDPPVARSYRIRKRTAEVLSSLDHHQAAATEFGDLARMADREPIRWAHFWETLSSERFHEALDLLNRPNYVPLRDPMEPLANEYWRGRAQELMGDYEGARASYAKVLEEGGNGFYAILVALRQPDLLKADRTNAAPTLPDSLGPSPTPAGLATRPVQNWPEAGESTRAHIEVVRDLLRVGLQQIAKVQLRGLSPRSLSPEDPLGEISQLAFLAHDYRASRGLEYFANSPIRQRPKGLASLLAHQEAFENEWKIYYPLAYDPIVSTATRELGVDKFLVLSIMRAESFYEHRARSAVGARGLMQVMPYTGFHIAREIGKTDFRVEDLEDPDVNIVFGAFYLGKLLKAYGHNIMLAAAAYNAGPAALNRWLQACSDCSMDVFVDSIPFWETRQYVKKVATNYANYQRIYAQNLVGLHLERPALADLDRADLY